MKIKKKVYRKAIFVVPYIKKSNSIKYILLKRKLHWIGWEFTKGGIEKSETPMLAVIRELKEETNLTPKLIESYDYKGKYTYDKNTKKSRSYIGQTFQLFSAQVKPGRIKLDKKEHSEYKLLSYTQAMELLTWPNQKKALEIVNKQIR